MIVENVCGAQKWVGRSRFAYGSFHLWGDIPGLMPEPAGQKNTGGSWFGQRDGQTLERNDPRDMRRGEDGEWTNAATVGGWNHPGKSMDGRKRPGLKISKGFNNWPKDENGAYVIPNGSRIGGRDDGRKQGGDWFGADGQIQLSRATSSRSLARRAASAEIAKIPKPLAEHIARVFKPIKEESAI